MDRLRWAFRIGFAAATLGGILALALNQTAYEQRLAVFNHYADARCTLETADGTRVKFSVRKDRRYRRTFEAPTFGFAIMRCSTDAMQLQTPGHFHLEDGGIAEVTFTPFGEVEVRHVRIRAS